MGDKPQNEDDIEQLKRFPEEGLPAPGKTKEKLDRIFDDLANIDGNIVNFYSMIRNAEQNISAELARRNDTIRKLQERCIFVIESAGYDIPVGKNAKYDRANGHVSIIDPSTPAPPPLPEPEKKKKKGKKKKKK